MANKMDIALDFVNRGILSITPSGEVLRCKLFTNTGRLKDVAPRRTEARLKNGYLVVMLREAKKQHAVYAHRLVWTILRGPIAPGLEINHKDGNKANNDPSNLEAITPSENSLHSHHVLKRSPRQKAIAPEVRARAMELRSQGRSFASIGRELNICGTTVLGWSRAAARS